MNPALSGSVFRWARKPSRSKISKSEMMESRRTKKGIKEGKKERLKKRGKLVRHERANVVLMRSPGASTYTQRQTHVCEIGEIGRKRDKKKGKSPVVVVMLRGTDTVSHWCAKKARQSGHDASAFPSRTHVNAFTGLSHCRSGESATLPPPTGVCSHQGSHTRVTNDRSGTCLAGGKPK